MTMFAAALLIAVHGALAPGDYTVVYDHVLTTKQDWDLLCEAPPAPIALAKGSPVRLTTDGAKFLFTASGRRFGTEQCDAETPTVMPTKVAQGVAEVRVSCATTRVVRGTEQGDTVYRFKGDGSIEARTVMQRRWRQAGRTCGLQRVRSTLLLPVASTDRVEDVVAAAARQADWVAVTIEHVNDVPQDFALVASRYELDTRPVLKDELRPDWGALDAGRARSIHGGLVREGMHVLAVEVTYEVVSAGKPVRVKLRDTLFFDVVDRPITIRVVGEESPGLFAEVKDRARIRFVVAP